MSNTKNKKIYPDQIRKILIIQFSPFGDVFLTSSIFESVKKHFPKAKLSYLVREPYQITVLDHPYLDEIITFPKKKGLAYLVERIKLFARIRKIGFDLIIDQQNNPGSQQIVLFSGAKWRLGYRKGQYAFVYNLKADVKKDRYTPAKRFDLLEPLGIKEDKWTFYYKITPESTQYIDNWLSENQLSEQKYFVVSPGSPVKKKIWNPDYYAELIKKVCHEFNMTAVIIWAPNELNDARYVLSQAGEHALLAPDTSINQGLALLKKAQLLICNDGGLNHFAVSTQTKTLAIFGNTHPTPWSPASVFPTHHHLFHERHPSMTDNTFGISVEETFNKVKEILNEK